MRNEIASAQKNGNDWRQVINELRPHIPKLWYSWPLFEKKQFLRHLFWLWNIHRHRMSPASASAIAYFKQELRLNICPGIVKSVNPTPDNKGLEIQYFSKKSGKVESLTADYVINCAGPDYNIAKRKDVLVQSILNKQLLLPDDLSFGFKLAQDDLDLDLAGKAQGKIFALGALLFGEKLETTAVPEIRQQAFALAKRILGG